jgi:signal transduction histidine kinase
VLGASWILIDRFTGSIAGVARAAEKIAAGDFSQKLGPVRNDELGVLYQSFNDMTKKLEQSYSDLELKISELKAARKKLLHSERMALMGEAVSKVSHEIQNKISGVSIWVQNLEMYLRTDDTAQAYIQELEIALDSFYQMMMRFKQFYREPVLHKSDVDICALFKQNMIWVEKECQDKKLRVNVTCHETVSARIDSELMSAAILNIMRNAIEFSPVDGVIDIDIENHDDKILITISDQGPGIDSGDIDEIFQPFYTTKSSGSGLGLPIAQNIVAAHGGKINVQNRTHGTQFTIQFPQKGTDNEHPDR